MTRSSKHIRGNVLNKELQRSWYSNCNGKKWHGYLRSFGFCVWFYYAFIIIRKAFKMVRFLSLRALLLKEGYDIYIFLLEDDVYSKWIKKATVNNEQPSILWYRPLIVVLFFKSKSRSIAHFFSLGSLNIIWKIKKNSSKFYTTIEIFVIVKILLIA